MLAAKKTMAYGGTSIELAFRPNADFYTVDDPEKRVDAGVFSADLREWFNRDDLDLSRPSVVVSDKTRLCGYPQYLPVLRDAMVEQGADPGRIGFYIAYGTHLRQSDGSSQAAYGSMFNDCNWIHHQCDADTFVKMGETRRGTPVHFRQDLTEASCIITFGAISHHYFAGYGGGRKLLFPGLGRKEDIYANHSLFLDTRTRTLAHGCRPGQLDGNPLAEDLAEIESFRPADLAVHGILNSRGEVCDLLVGQGDDHFRGACARHAAGCEAAVKRRYDLVVASCGGYPKDINFIQSHKAIHHAAEFVRDGGRLIVLAECRDGIGSHTFLPWFEPGGWDAAFDRLAGHYAGNGGTALAMMAKLQRIRISLVTQLDVDVADRIGVESISASKAQAAVDRHKGALAVIPNASLTVLKVSSSGTAA